MHKITTVIPNEKKLAVVLCSTANQDFAVANTLIGFKKHVKLLYCDYDVILYTDGLFTTESVNALKKIYPEIILKRFKAENYLNSIKNHSQVKRFSLLAFARYECFNLLSEYEQVFYTDTDVLFQRDISNLFVYSDNDITSMFLDVRNIKTDIAEYAYEEFKILTNNKYDLSRPKFITGFYFLIGKSETIKLLLIGCIKKL